MNLDHLLAIETKYDMLAKNIDGFAYWTFFRQPLLEELHVSAGYGIAHTKPKFSRKRQMATRLNMIKNALLYGNGFKRKCDILILNDERRKWMGSHYESVFTDWVAAAYPNSIVLERPYNQQHFRPVMTRRLVYTDYIEIKAMASYVWHQKFAASKMRQIRKQIEENVRVPIRELCEIEGIDYDISRIVDMMLCGYYVYKVKKREYTKILNRYRPKLVLEICGYNLDCMTVNELTKERQIPSVELQHGYTGMEHTAYNYPEMVDIEQFPKYFFAFSDYWIKSARYPIPESNLKAVGFPYLEREAAKAKSKVTKGKMKKIIFISQGPIGLLLSKIAVDLNKLLDKEQYKIIYKLHPGEFVDWRERYVELARSGIMVADSNKYNLYELFAESSFQVGGYGSTATYEGFYFGLETFILREKADAELIALCKSGVAKCFDTAQELYQLIIEAAGKEEKVFPIQFWQEDAENNIRRELDHLLERYSGDTSYKNADGAS